MATLFAANAFIIGVELTSWAVLPGVAKHLDGDHLYGLASSVSPLGTLASVIYASHAIRRRGCRVVALWGVAIGSFGVVLIALAPSMPVVLVGRFLNGATGLTLAASMVVVSSTLAAHQRSRATAYMTCAPLAVAVAIPQLADVLTNWVNWRVGYLPILAFALTAAWLVFRSFPGSGDEPVPVPDALTNRRLARSAALILCGSAVLVMSLGVAIHVALTVAIVAAAISMMIRGFRPLFSSDFMTPGLRSAFAIRGLWAGSVMALQSFETFALVRILDAPGWIVGVGLAVMELGIALGGWLFFHLHRSVSVGAIQVVAALLAALASAAFGLFVLLGASVVAAILAMFVRHVAWGAGFGASAELVTARSPEGRAADSSAVATITFALGFVVGPAIAGAAFARLDTIPAGAEGAIAFATAVAVVGLVAAAGMDRIAARRMDRIAARKA
jgi:MFS family permease